MGGIQSRRHANDQFFKTGEFEARHQTLYLNVEYLFAAFIAQGAIAGHIGEARGRRFKRQQGAAGNGQIKGNVRDIKQSWLVVAR